MSLTTFTLGPPLLFYGPSRILAVANQWLHQESAHRPGVHDVHQVWASTADVGLWLRVTRFDGGAWYHAALLRFASQPIVLAEEEIPDLGRRWELRSSGLWADHNCETPLDHWSYGLEAFALALDDPLQLVRDGVGDRVPIGWEIEFEASEEAAGLPGIDGYEQRGVVHGITLTAEGETAFEAPAVRQHWWGEPTDQPAGIWLPGSPAIAPTQADQAVVQVGSARLLIALGHGVTVFA